MENASKALLIAGGVLITMIVASLGVYLYSVYHEHSENMLAAMSEKEVSEFNSKFWAFEGRELTANELISVLNLARNNNFSKIGEEYKIIVEGQGGWSLLGQGDFKYLTQTAENTEYERQCREFLQKNLNEDISYRCYDFEYSEITGLINKLKVDKIRQSY